MLFPAPWYFRHRWVRCAFPLLIRSCIQHLLGAHRVLGPLTGVRRDREVGSGFRDLMLQWEWVGWEEDLTA